MKRDLPPPSEHVSIEIQDSKKFAEIALVVDNPHFMQGVFATRQRLVIPKPSNESLRDFENYPFTKEERRSMNNPEFGSDVESFRTYIPTDEQIKKYNGRQLCLQLVYKVADKFILRFGCSHLMQRAIVAAIVCNKVVDEDLDMARIGLIGKERFESEDSQSQVLAIEITPSTRKEDVLEEFKKLKSYKNDYSAFQLFVNSNLGRDTTSHIKEDRELYWLFRNNPKHTYQNYVLKHSSMSLPEYKNLFVNQDTNESVNEYNRKQNKINQIKEEVKYIAKRVKKYQMLISKTTFLET